MIVEWDSFARAGLERRSHGPGQCDWCGTKFRRVFIYVLSRDGDPGAVFLDRRHRSGKAFCSLSCYRFYFL
jgi:hypothetical protein